MRIYTRTGDSGETELQGGTRVRKDTSRIEACGTVDELNSYIGLALVHIKDTEIVEVLRAVQNDLFDIGADLTILQEEKRKTVKPAYRMTKEHITTLENRIDSFEAALKPLTRFVLPGGSEGASTLHVARTVCRRAERRVVTLAKKEQVNPEVLRYLNRLSDLLFLLARTVNQRLGVVELTWEARE